MALQVLWPSGLGNYFVCKRFAVQTLVFSLEFVIQIKLEHDIIAITQRTLHNHSPIRHFPVGIYLLKVNNRNTGTRCEICSKLTIKTPERRQWHRSGVFTVNFKHILHLVLVFLLLTLNM